MPRRLIVIHNALAGAGHEARLAMVLARLAALGATAHVVETVDPEEAFERATAAARGGQADVVVAAGGDGTLRQVAAGVAAAGAGSAGVSVGLIPLGTGNVVATEIGLGKRAGDIARTLACGPTIEISGAHANGEPFFAMCGVGFDGRCIAGLSSASKRRIGKLAFARPTLEALRLPVDALEIDCDGDTHYAAWVIVTNTSHYAGGFVLTRRTHIGTAGLQLVMFKGETRRALVGRAITLGLGQLDARADLHGDVVMLPCNTVTIRGRGPVPVQVDGDPMAATPVTITAADGPRIRLVVPPST